MSEMQDIICMVERRTPIDLKDDKAMKDGL